MLNDNIRKYRKENNLSQDELAEKLGVSRQSVSLWENGQTQPTVENIIALSKIFHVSADELLGNTGADREPREEGANGKNVPAVPPAADQNVSPPSSPDPKKNKGGLIAVVAVIAGLLLIGGAVAAALIILNAKGILPMRDNSQSGEETVSSAGFSSESAVASLNHDAPSESTLFPTPYSVTQSETSASGGDFTETLSAWESDVIPSTETPTPPTPTPPTPTPPTPTPPTHTPPTPSDPEEFDLFAYCKEFAIRIGDVNGDHCIYQEPSSKYGGYPNEYFSMAYWADSNMVEFCLHCPLDATYSINFYLRMRGGYDHQYEYTVSRYYRDTGVSLRFAKGYIDPATFNDRYPLNCVSYVGSTDGQNEFMEESRVGMCDLIKCLKEFARVEHMDCGFSAFEFVNF